MMSEKLYSYDNGNNKILCNLLSVCDFNVSNVFQLLNSLANENEQLRDELTFLNKVISFFADNPMTKYSSKSELLEEMKLFEKMGLI